jgi:chromate transporter
VNTPLAPPPSLLQLACSFAYVGLTSFGGGLSAWMRLHFVTRKRWLSEDSFLLGLSMSQALPGVNIVNLSIWIGYELRGSLGALAATAGMLLPSAVFIIVFSQIIAQLSGYELTHLALAGVAASGFGLALSIGLFAAKRRARDVTSALVLIAAFAGIFVFKLSTVVVLVVLAPISIGLAYWKVKRDART